MLKPRRFLFSVAAMTVVMVSAQSKVTIPVRRTQAYDGRQMYVNYCAPCHGLDGRGAGPAASALKSPPTDLSQLSKSNNGIYPAKRMIAVLEFGTDTPAHGSKEMPIWGPILQKVNHRGGGGEDTQTLRINNLVKYLETLQIK